MPAKPDTKSSPPPPDADNTRDDEPKTFDLSLTQVVGGALAAMTAAYLGSRLSVAGTVIGAAIASIVAGVGGSLYTASLRHTRDKVRSVWTGRTNTTPTEVVVTRETQHNQVPDWGQGTTSAATAPALQAESNDAAAATGVVETPTPGGPGEPPLWRTGRFWKRIAVAAVATFALAAGAITGLELVSGQALSGGEGTTVERVRQPQADPPAEKPSDEPSESPSDAPSNAPSESETEGTEAPTEAPSESPSQQPSESAGEEPSAAPSSESSAAPDAPGQADRLPEGDAGRGPSTGVTPGAG